MHTNHNSSWHISLELLDPAQVAWYQHKPDRDWDQGLFVDISEDLSDPTLELSNQSQAIGEQTISGDMTHPLADDDTLLNSHLMGLRLDEDYQHPKELDIATDVELAEKYFRNIKPYLYPITQEPTPLINL